MYLSQKEAEGGWCYSNPMIVHWVLGKKRVTGARVMAAPSPARGVATPTTECAFVLHSFVFLLYLFGVFLLCLFCISAVFSPQIVSYQFFQQPLHNVSVSYKMPLFQIEKCICLKLYLLN